MATIEEVEKASLEYFDGDELAANVFATKYALADREGNLLEMTPDDMHHRLAKEFARIEAKYPNPMSEEEIFDLFKGFKKVIPQGSPTAAVGNPFQIQSTSNCFVLESPFDSYGGICKADQELVQIAKRRGGVGFDISTLRPKGMSTSNAAKTTDGIEIFMDRFSNSCREVAQNGRRGALMQSISCFDGSVLILTENGLLRIDKIVNEEYKGKVWTHEGWKEIEAYQKIENKDLYEIECENGKKIKVTADHKFLVKNIETNEEYLKEIQNVNPENEELVFYSSVL